jgi:hypothetical protein
MWLRFPHHAYPMDLWVQCRFGRFLVQSDPGRICVSQECERAAHKKSSAFFTGTSDVSTTGHRGHIGSATAVWSGTCSSVS